MLHGPNAHATISGNSSRQNAPPCDPARSVITTSAPASCKRDCPPGRVLEEERLQRARNEVRARNRTRHHPRRTVTRARRGAEDRTVEVRMPKPDRERQLPPTRATDTPGGIAV